MIDTIALTLQEGEFQITDHNRFSPNTENLYSYPYIKVTSRSPFKARNNPTKQDKETHGYLPRLTLIKALRDGGFSTFLRIEFSAPKLLHGNNFDELEESDFGELCWELKRKLSIMGVEVKDVKLLMYANVSAIHYSKNIILTDFTDPHTYIKEIAKININRLLDTNATDFRNEGHSFKYRSNDFEVIIYDKVKDLQQSRISEKRAIESDNYVQSNILEEIKKTKPFEVLRLEVRLGSRKKISQLLKKYNLTHREKNFSGLFSKDVSKAILSSIVHEIDSAYPRVLKSNKETLEEFLADIQVNNPTLRLSSLLKFAGAKALLEEIGVRQFRILVNRFGPSQWYRLNKGIKDLKLGSEADVFANIRKGIDTFEKVELKQYSDQIE